MKNKKGFTLTEILLAVMIVGIIGVALAALTTAASRESGVGRSKVLLRNNLSIVLRQLRRDIRESSEVLYVRGDLGSSLGTDKVALLALGQNVYRADDGSLKRIKEAVKDASNDSNKPRFILYCFERGNGTKNQTTASGAKVQPEGAYDGGKLYRQELDAEPSWSGGVPVCGAGTKILDNVKYIPSNEGYPVPLFRLREFDGVYSIKTTSKDVLKKNLGSVLQVNLITELPSSPVVNDVTEETFVLPNGFAMN